MQDKINQRDAQCRPHGPWKEYYSNGQLIYIGEYVHGELHGTWIGYYTDGTLSYKKTFDMGKQIRYNIEY
jgi:antitoxin component YwqK of YwqJK toxin-antitoxin module